MTTHFEHRTRPAKQRLAYLEKKTAELERELADARESLDRELSHYAYSWAPTPHEGLSTGYEVPEGTGDGYDGGSYDGDLYDGYDADSDATSLIEPPSTPVAASAPNHTNTGGDLFAAEARTATLINHGRRSAPPRQVSKGVKVAAGAIFVLALVIALIVLALPGPGATWPASVARVQAEITKACENPDVSSEPDQVNFACGKATRQILWVFALLTSGNDPTFAQAGTGREGLEPITPQQGGVVAWSLNLHHPYDPVNPIDSLAVAARAINNIVGGATVTGTYGKPVVQRGLEGHAANCLRYTGSASVTAHKGFPGLCARPVSSPAGEAALVSDIYQRWVVGASPKAAQVAATLFANARNPGSPQVQSILKHLPGPGR